MRSKEPSLQAPQDSFLEALHSESVAGTENLSAWVKQVQEQEGIEILFELETWLKGLRSFFDLRHLPLSETERSNLLDRSFASEINLIRNAVQSCERCASEVIRYGQPRQVEFETFLETQLRKDSVLDYHVDKILEQPTPTESLRRLLESLNDFRVLIDALRMEKQNYQLFHTLGRSLRRDLKGCRYVDMLLSQRFRVQYDRIQNPVLSTVMRGIAEEKIRRDIALTLLYLFRLLRYLKLIAHEMNGERPVRHLLVVFSLVHEDMEHLSDFLKSRFLKGREAGHSLRNSAELIVYSLKMESQRALERELIGVAQESEIADVYTRIGSSHALLRNCFQSCVVTLLQAFDRQLEAKSVFPSMIDRLQQAEKLKQDLWDLRQFLRNLMEKKEELDSHRIVERVSAFRESSLRYLMYRDWGEFERFSDALVAATGRMEIRTLLKKFGSFLETLIQEVSKRSVFSRSDAEVPTH